MEVACGLRRRPTRRDARAVHAALATRRPGAKRCGAITAGFRSENASSWSGCRRPQSGDRHRISCRATRTGDYRSGRFPRDLRSHDRESGFRPSYRPASGTGRADDAVDAVLESDGAEAISVTAEVAMLRRTMPNRAQRQRRSDQRASPISAAVAATSAHRSWLTSSCLRPAFSGNNERASVTAHPARLQYLEGRTHELEDTVWTRTVGPRRWNDR